MTDNILHIGVKKIHPDDAYQVDELRVLLDVMMQFCPKQWKWDGLSVDFKDKGNSEFFVNFGQVPEIERHLAFEWCKNMLVLFFGGYNFLSCVRNDLFFSDAEWEDGRYLPEIYMDVYTARRVMSENSDA